jgi:predicted carbohydrate-binding protein with CBM5 and CBM33 domain
LIRIAALASALLLLTAASALGYVAVVAARRSEGVFVPAGYVALICLVGAVVLIRVASRH